MTSGRANLLQALRESFAAAVRPPEGWSAPVAFFGPMRTDSGFLCCRRCELHFPGSTRLAGMSRRRTLAPQFGSSALLIEPFRKHHRLTKVQVLYLPHVRRQDLRAAGDCPANLQPLVELQYRGRVWHQSNGHDWTVRAFLVSNDGLGLDIASDRRTEEAMLRALPLLTEVEVSALQGRRLDADDFDKLAVDDPVRDLLLWLNSPGTFEAAAKGGAGRAFARSAAMNSTLILIEPPPRKSLESWWLPSQLLDRVWNRFAESPQLYVGVAKLMREPAGRGQGELMFDGFSRPTN